MADTITFHDYIIESLLVEARQRRLVLRAFDPHAPTAPISVAEFTGLAGYHLVGDVLGTILFDIEECDPFTLYDGLAGALQDICHGNGGFDNWVATPEGAKAFIAANAIRGFEVTSSIGAVGAIWCRGFRAWAEPGGAA